MNAAEYQKIARHGISYNDERSRGFLSAYIEGKAGDVLIRYPRCLHGGTPNHASTPRPMISMMAYSKEANAAYPDIYKSLQVPEDQQRLPRFGSLRQEVNEWIFENQTARYGEMRTLSGEADIDM